jgi:hypothetical protein
MARSLGLPIVSTEQALQTVAALLKPSGFDLVQPFPVGLYNHQIRSPLQPLDDLGSEQNLGILIGNTRALWEPFCGALRAQPRLCRAPHPLEQYTEQRVSAAVAALGLRHDVRFAHELGPRLVAMQRLAVLSGLAWLSPSQLCIHPTYGPWISLRAVVVLPLPAPPAAPLLAAPCACDQVCASSAKRVAAEADHPDSWRSHLALRMSCAVGQAHAFSEEQSRYHYCRNERAAVLRLVRG